MFLKEKWVRSSQTYHIHDEPTVPSHLGKKILPCDRCFTALTAVAPMTSFLSIEECVDLDRRLSVMSSRRRKISLKHCGGKWRDVKWRGVTSYRILAIYCI